MAWKGSDGIPNRCCIGLHCWLEPLSLRSSTGTQLKQYTLATILSHFTWQRPFEAITTVAFTGVHIFGLLAVIYWFFLESEQKYSAAKWLLHPLQQYNRDLELQRDIWWYPNFLKYCASLSWFCVQGRWVTTERLDVLRMKWAHGSRKLGINRSSSREPFGTFQY